jgi:NADH-quinone oxidoreductase subunit E/NADP-reducing hydrogenase subunit HndA
MRLIAQEPPPPAGALLAKLHSINAAHGYLPESELRAAADELGVPLSQLQVCLGTACYIRGGDRLLEKLESLLGVEPGSTTEDQAFTLETAYCFGSCSMAPVVRIDGEPYGRLRADQLPRILKSYRHEEAGDKEGGA